MNPFIKDHAAPLVGSAALHVLIGAAAIFATLFTVAPHIDPPAAIQAYIATKPAPRPAAPPPAPPPPAAETAPQPVPEQAPPPAPVPDTHAKEKAEADAREAALVIEKAAEARRAAEAAAQKRAQEAEEAKREQKRKAAQQEAERRAAEAKRRADAAAEAQRRADAAERAQRESDLDKQLAREEHRDGVVNSGLMQQYLTAIKARIERSWIRPPTAQPGLSCWLDVTQVPGGTVTNVRVGKCNGDAAVQDSIVNAVQKASPLPPAPDPSLFDRNLHIEFAPQ